VLLGGQAFTDTTGVGGALSSSVYVNTAPQQNARSSVIFQQSRILLNQQPKDDIKYRVNTVFRIELCPSTQIASLLASQTGSRRLPFLYKRLGI
jgi:hypothetical protein